MFDHHINFGYSNVLTPPSPANSGPSLTVLAGEGSKFPSASFNVSIWPAGSTANNINCEICKVTGVSTDTLLMTRAQEGTSARTILVGDQIAATITAKTITDIEGINYNLIGSGDPASNPTDTGQTWTYSNTGTLGFWVWPASGAFWIQFI